VVKAMAGGGSIPDGEQLVNVVGVDFVLATDILSRGMDLRDLSHVINFEVPSSSSVYLHRAGRVGRLGSGAPVKGAGRLAKTTYCPSVITLSSSEEKSQIEKLQKNLDITVHRLLIRRDRLVVSKTNANVNNNNDSNNNRHPLSSTHTQQRSRERNGKAKEKEAKEEKITPKEKNGLNFHGSFVESG